MVGNKIKALMERDLSVGSLNNEEEYERKGLIK